jgi:glycosyltransferase involved in cell wall biosynthesis
VIEEVPVIRVAGKLLGDREKLPRPLQRFLYLLALLVLGWTLWRHRHSYDIVHLYHLSLEVLPVAFACRLTGKPLIVSVRSAGSSTKPYITPAAGSTHSAPPPMCFERKSRRGGDIEALARFGKPAVLLARRLLQRTGAVVVVLSSRMKSYLAEYSFHPLPVQLIPNGVDIKRFHPLNTSPNRSETNVSVVCVSRLRPEKGIDVLLRAWKIVCMQMPLARLIIVGNGPLQSQLKHMAEELDISDTVEFTGLQSDIAAQFHRGDLAVLPSLYEGMPNALLEAMACGLPCVATWVSGSEDIIQQGMNGLLVEPGDYQGLAEALLTLMYSPERMQSYGCVARATIEAHYSIERVTDLYVELYQHIADRRGVKNI